MKLSANELYVLSSLSNGDQYGLGIIKEVKESGVELYLGGLYTILRRLEKQKYIKGYYKEETEGRAGNRRRYYKILAAGDRALDEARAALIDLWGLKILNSSMLSPLKDLFFFFLNKGKYFLSLFNTNKKLVSKAVGVIRAVGAVIGIVAAGGAVGAVLGIIGGVVGLLVGVGAVLGIIAIIAVVRKVEMLQKGMKVESLKNETSNFLKRKLFSLRYLLPKKYRDEIMGDLIEIKNDLKEEGHGKPWILTILLGQFLSIIYSMLWFKLGEVYEKKVLGKKEGEMIPNSDEKPLNLMDNPIKKENSLYTPEQLDEMRNREDYGT